MEAGLATSPTGRDGAFLLVPRERQAVELRDGVEVQDPLPCVLRLQFFKRRFRDDALAAAGVHAAATADVMALKYRKLVLNLGNGVEVITGQPGWAASGALGAFVENARQEAMAVYAAAGIRSTSPAEYAERVTAFYKAAPVGGEARSASSTLQSVLRGQATTEVDYLNGEIELLGKLHGVATPYNTVIRRTATRMASSGEQPGGVTIEELQAMVDRLRASPPV